MLRKFLPAFALVAALCTPALLACACQNKAGDPNAPTFVFPAAIGWATSLDDALKSAQAKNKPIAVYFASTADFAVIGEPPETVQKVAAENGNSIPTSVFELPKLATHLRAAGVVEFVKIAHAKDPLAAKLQAQPFTLMILSPSGEKLDSASVLGGALDKKLASAKSKIAAWQSATAAK